MASSFSPDLLPGDSPAALRHRVMRAYFAATAAVALMGVVVWSGLGLGPPQPLDLRLPLMLFFGALALVGAIAAYLPPRQAETALPVVSLGTVIVSGLAAGLTGWGLSAPGLVAFSIVVCMTWAVGQRGAGVAVTASAIVAVGLLGLAEILGVLPEVPGATQIPAIERLLVHWTMVAASGVGGSGISRLLARHVAAAATRERRFQSLLAIAAAAYWETDATLRLRRVSYRDANGQFVPLDKALGRMPWNVGALGFATEVADAVRADMEGREPLRDVPCVWQRSDGSELHFLASGQPRKDPQGRFLGYWGVARDVTAERLAREALQLTERRYQELFVRLPTPLVLHRHGHILDANPAAAQLLGYPSVARMVGHDLLVEHLDAAGRATVQGRLQHLDQTLPGEPLPPQPLDMLTVQGTTVHVRAMGSRADSAGAPATLTMLIDETASLAAARAQARTEELFAQVLSTSPDVITLTDTATGQYLVVNESFCQLTGYSVDEVVGRTSVELGIWRHPEDRDRLLALLKERGSVQNVTLEFVTKHGQTVPLLVSASIYEREGRQRLVINARDLTDMARLRLEREAILDNASVGIAFTRGRRFELVNPQFERIYGWPPGTLAGQPTRVLWGSDEEEAALGQAIGPALRRGDATEVELQGLRHDGSRFLVRLRAKALDPLHPGQHGTIWIAEDVTRQRQDEQSLARARDEAEAASRAKSTFLANTSHEIRTPLNGLLGLARMARQPGIPAQRQREYLDQIAENAESLSMIISDILDLSKIEAGKLEVESTPFDLRELLHTLQQAYAALAAGHGLAFSVEIDRALPGRVRGDPLRVRQILSNYLHNALKFTTSGSIRLVVQWRAGFEGRGDLARFEVHDTGPGIDEATLARLFKPFSQGDDSTSRRFGGTGLGLSICQELATLMGGSVGVSSTPGKGSCFHAELPLPAADDAADSEPGALGDEHLLRGARVLLAEDNAVNMLIATALLEQWGAQVRSANDGAEALERIAEAEQAGTPVQVVLMDLQMPGMSGFEVTQALRQRYDAARLPVIALTASALVSERERAAEAGMTDFVTKPIDAQRLRNALLRALSTSGGAAAGG